MPSPFFPNTQSLGSFLASPDLEFPPPNKIFSLFHGRTDAAFRTPSCLGFLRCSFHLCSFRLLPVTAILLPFFSRGRLVVPNKINAGSPKSPPLLVIPASITRPRGDAPPLPNRDPPFGSLLFLFKGRLPLYFFSNCQSDSFDIYKSYSGNAFPSCQEDGLGFSASTILVPLSSTRGISNAADTPPSQEQKVCTPVEIDPPLLPARFSLPPTRFFLSPPKRRGLSLSLSSVLPPAQSHSY